MVFNFQLESDTLLLEPLTLNDASLIIELFNDPDSLRYIGDKHIKTEEEARRYLKTGPFLMYQQHGVGLLKIVRKSDGAAMGLCGLLKRDYLEFFDLGYALLPGFRGQGVTTEACQLLINWSFSKYSLTTLKAIVSPDNGASICILQKLGFVEDGFLDDSALGKSNLCMTLQLSEFDTTN